MVIRTFNANLIVQDPQATARSAQAAAKASAATSREAQRAADKALGDQIGNQVRAQIARDLGQDGVPVPPTPPAAPREFTIRGPNGELTTIGMPNSNDIIPQQAVDISLAFFFTIAAIIIGLPIARAFARRMDRKSGGTAQIPSEVSAQLAHLNQAVDAIAVEVERISEGQRFTTRLLSEQRDAAHQTLPSGTGR
ncbi:MAG TPA: hypothetical protein VGO75_13495 [Gemmatimonadaceae bacterium]|jgi:hypothetical protein|nr:hypothetical protein [Gemmatimonadaceae bacterium]